MIKVTDQPVEYTHTRIKKSSLAKAKKIVAKKSKYASVAHMLEVLIDEASTKQ